MQEYNVINATIADIHAAMLAGTLTCRALVEAYLKRIAAYDQSGPKLNAVIRLNPKALATSFPVFLARNLPVAARRADGHAGPAIRERTWTQKSA